MPIQRVTERRTSPSPKMSKGVSTEDISRHFPTMHLADFEPTPSQITLGDKTQAIADTPKRAQFTHGRKNGPIPLVGTGPKGRRRLFFQTVLHSLVSPANERNRSWYLRPK